jgi:hypothetical protein
VPPSSGRSYKEGVWQWGGSQDNRDALCLHHQGGLIRRVFDNGAIRISGAKSEEVKER